ncbi:MAG TPA: TatD family hydrolase [Vulgatibacter sp.]|nr:TatD family hydrolase [Vulgatibacter sp.]
MEPLPAIFDAQIHLGGLADQDLKDLAYFGVDAAVAVAGDDAPAGDGRELFAHLEELVTAGTTRMRQAGIAPFFALGVHPRRIPSAGFQELVARMPELFDKGRVVAIGAIGLQEGGAREESAFQTQLELAASLELPVIVHTPEHDKPRMVRRTLSLLREADAPPERVLVGGVDATTLRLVRSCGYTAGLLVHPSRIPADDAASIVRQYGAAGLVLASDAGAGPGDILAVPRTLHLLEVVGISPKIIRRVARDNAIAFFGIDRGAIEPRS